MGCTCSDIKLKESIIFNKKGNLNDKNQKINMDLENKNEELDLNKQIFEKSNNDNSIKEKSLDEKDKIPQKINNEIYNININNKKESKNTKNKISFKCIYDIKDFNYTQIINNQYEYLVNEEIEQKIKIINNNKKENIVFQKRFDKLGINEIDFIIEENLSNMCFMFNNCTSLKKIKFISIDTSKVTDMSRMFLMCQELEYIDLSNFDTSNVTNMEGMFAACIKLKEIKGLNKLNTTKVSTMSVMFLFCKN